MKTLIAFCCLVGAALLSNLSAAEIPGKVSEASGEIATVIVEGDLVPAVGDAATIFFRLPGADEEISVADGKVAEVSADVVKVKIENATGTVSADQLARFTSERPQKKTVAAAAPDSSTAATAPTAALPPLQPAPTPSAVPKPVQQVVHFDKLAAGPLPFDAFDGVGVRFVQGKGAPIVAKAERNMVLPKGRKQVLLMSGDRVTSVTMTFKKPLRRFALTRIGTAGGASVPTWTLDAYDSEGKVVGSAGEEHGLPPKPQQFFIEGDGIVRVQLSTDNRFGSGTWATWNSLPVAEFEIER